ncbi:MAG: hypothetical protein LBT00_14615 [Spirochaetaceae bacterium]|nr:hypothetical protein [Spirochaetaceae bacterium]
MRTAHCVRATSLRASRSVERSEAIQGGPFLTGLLCRLAPRNDDSATNRHEQMHLMCLVIASEAKQSRAGPFLTGLLCR